MKFTSFINESEDEQIRIVIITGRKDRYNKDNLYKTASKIVKKCKERKIPHYVAYSESCYIARDKNDVWRIYNSDDENGFVIDKNNTVFIVRKSVTKLKMSLDVLSQIEKRDIFTINSRDCIEKCNDKYRTILLLTDNDVPCPKTALVTDEGMLDTAINKIGGRFPVIMKTVSGSKGIGVFKSDSIESLRSTLQAIWKIDPNTEIIMQEYIGSDGDIRVHVLGNKIIGAMKRLRISGDFRSNYSLGSEIEKVRLTDEQRRIALLAAKAVGAVWAGIDIIQSGKNSYVIEVNSSPGTEGIEKVTGKDIVGKVIDFVLDKKNWVVPTKEVGYIETVYIEGFGNIKAKMDTGNGGYCVIHADNISIDGNKVKWKFNGKEISKEHQGNKKMKIRGVLDKYEERPVVKLDVTFGGTTYKDVMFTLTNRGNMTTPVLISRDFIKRANLSVNPRKKYAASLKEDMSILSEYQDDLQYLNNIEEYIFTNNISEIEKIRSNKPYLVSILEESLPKLTDWGICNRYKRILYYVKNI